MIVDLVGTAFWPVVAASVFIRADQLLLLGSYSVDY
jgi:hypothetical protein